MSEKKIKFEFEKQNKNSIRYKEVPEDGLCDAFDKSELAQFHLYHFSINNIQNYNF